MFANADYTLFVLWNQPLKSQRKVAEQADLSSDFIRGIECEVESPSVDNLVKTARALGVRVRELVEEF